ncbi:MAG: serine O-acetyltransferase [Candidatus Omnitrophica bacterium]|nr:serine O-acetyltransferase [Candidatus Omnitrophota bacterium]
MGILHVLVFIVFIFFSAILVVAVVFAEEIKSAKEKDPSSKGYLEIILLYPGLHAIIAYRMSHVLWKAKLTFLARALSQLARFLTGVEIHPGAEIGKGFFIDHGMGVVIGETSIIGDNVTLFQGVTLGGTGKETGKRHPTLGDNIVVGAGAKVLGNIQVGSNSYVGANAVVVRGVPENTTVVGVPGHVTKQDGKRIDLMMDHVHISDPIMQHLRDIVERLKILESKDKEGQL